jgi:DNA-binding transcriptional LysR family regulator
VRGLGIAVVPSLAVQGDLRRGELVAVLPDVLRSDGRIALVYPERELVAPPVRAFVDWLVARAPTALAPPADSGRETRGRPGKPAGRVARVRR